MVRPLENLKENPMTQENLAIYQTIEATTPRSAWRRGVKEYALELIDSAEIALTRDNARTALLNGAQDWSAYSFGGCAEIYDADIAERLCSPSELKRKNGGDLQPNSRESWLDVQARALFQAFNLIKSNL